ncbi:MAG TPA: hypothetical protein VHT30_10900 [Acidimicrobiales bacterium]|jgi:hypothetical protein|nr:hypothetical protein [Acidimicrobiales bacterium]
MKAIGLDTLFKKNRERYKKLAKEAYAYTATTLAPTNQAVRQDDVSGHLEASIELDMILRSHLASKKKTQQYWSAYFTNLILDELWEELKHEHDASGG